MVSTVGYDHVICWNTIGDCLVIKQNFLLESQVLPKYYKSSNIFSFKRQLNKNGFRIKKSNESQCSYYTHPFFKQDRPDLLRHFLIKAYGHKNKKMMERKDGEL